MTSVSTDQLLASIAANGGGGGGPILWENIEDAPSEFPPSAHEHAVGDIEATGTAGATTYLRGDGSWTTPPDTNTTYSTISQANIENPASTSSGLVTGQRAAQAVAAYLAANPLLTVPTPPAEGTFTLQSVDGVVSWVEATP